MSAMSIDADARLDYQFDWRAQTHGHGKSDWLAAGETITAYSVTPSSGLTVDSAAEADGQITAWVSPNGLGTSALQRLTCRITTSQGRTDDRTRQLVVRNR